MEIIVEKIAPPVTLGGTCNCGSNPSGNQGSMCRSSDRPEGEVATPLLPPLSGK